jgi:primase-polymerase (primpol)-like protein
MTAYTLAPVRQYIGWKAVWNAARAKWDKFPCDWQTAAVVDAHDAQYWTDADTARAAAQRWGAPYGAGIVITEADPYWFLDIDHCRKDGVWSPMAVELCAALDGCFIETSHSGEGLHIIGRGAVPSHRIQDDTIGLALYTRLRFCALTFSHATGSMEHDHTAAIATVAARYLPPAETTAAPAEWTDGPCEGYGGPADDDDLIRIACAATSARGAFGGLSFRQVWEADEDALGRAFPDAGERAYDASRADAALLQHLAFWTGKDCARMERIARRSALVRDKWDRGDYIRRTILHAVGSQTTVATGKRETASPGPAGGSAASGSPPAEAADPPRTGIVHASDVAEHFKGAVYIEDRYLAAAPDGTLLKPQQFCASSRYGGRYIVTTSEGKGTRNAWEAWTESEVFRPPFAHTLCFRPCF